MTFKYPLIAIFLFFIVGTSFSRCYVSVTDGAWTNPAVWTLWGPASTPAAPPGGSIPPCALPIVGAPTVPGSPFGPNWFTDGIGDTIVIRHTVNQANFNIFVRHPDILIVDTCGVLNAGCFPNNQLLNLSSGIIGFGYGSNDAGIYVFGQVNVGSLRNSALFTLETTGLITTDTTCGGTGNIDNFGDMYISGDIIITGGDFNHNANRDLWIYNGGNIEIYGDGINNGNFNNRGIIRNLFPNSCIRLLGGQFINFLNAAVIGNGGISADGNIDNSANSIANWDPEVSWCSRFGSGINIPAASEDCNSPCALPLPVSITEFSATPTSDGSVSLDWETKWEVNAASFIIEKSPDQEVFTEIGMMDAAGTTYQPTSYNFMDNYPYGITHYRLKQIDQNGDFVYTEIRTVNLDNLTLEFDMYPNPADQLLSLNVRPGKVQVPVLTIYDSFGKAVKKMDLEVLHTDIDVSDLIPGIYIVNVVSGTEKVSRKLAIK